MTARKRQTWERCRESTTLPIGDRTEMMRLGEAEGSGLYRREAERGREERGEEERRGEGSWGRYDGADSMAIPT